MVKNEIMYRGRYPGDIFPSLLEAKALRSFTIFKYVIVVKFT